MTRVSEWKLLLEMEQSLMDKTKTRLPLSCVPELFDQFVIDRYNENLVNHKAILDEIDETGRLGLFCLNLRNARSLISGTEEFFYKPDWDPEHPPTHRSAISGLGLTLEIGKEYARSQKISDYSELDTKLLEAALAHRLGSSDSLRIPLQPPPARRIKLE